jgi:serine/threonine-protein kinase
MSHTPDQEFLALQEALVGRYSLEREVGRGGMGIVYLAHEVSLDRPVALKLLPPTLATQPRLRERFLREARTAAKLSHPNIVPIFAVDEVDEFVFFAMAYIDGESLGHRIRRSGPLPASEAARILREVAWALAYAHAQGVIHRDVKPDNVLLERGSGRALVADFGIAHVHEQSGATRPAEILGTAEFMSPEQASGQEVDHRSDLYSLGVVGYYAVSAQLPFEAPSVAALLAKRLAQPAPPVSTVAPEIPRRLTQVIDRCLVKEIAHRFATAEELTEALGRALQTSQELPVPLRVFIKQNREGFRALWILFFFLAFFLLPNLFGFFFYAGGFLGGVGITLLAMVGVFALAPLPIFARTARRLIRSGYGVEDAISALKADAGRRREELAFEFGGKVSLVERLARFLALASLAGFVAGIAGAVIAPGSVPSAVLMGFSLPIGIGAGLVAASRYERRRDVVGERRLRFWNSRLGRWVFKVAGMGLKRLPEGGAATYRRTELAIGLAADRLFKELPKQLRQSLGELPVVVRRLEADAQRMRARLDELNGILGDVSREGVAGQVLSSVASAKGSVTEQRDDLVEDLRAARDGAQRRLADAVASLETIRLDLLRMQAGVHSVDSVTANLASASSLSDEIERLLEGQREVERLLQDVRDH